jgi:hypothetical protein
MPTAVTVLGPFSRSTSAASPSATKSSGTGDTDTGPNASSGAGVESAFGASAGTDEESAAVTEAGPNVPASTREPAAATADAAMAGAADTLPAGRSPAVATAAEARGAEVGGAPGGPVPVVGAGFWAELRASAEANQQDLAAAVGDTAAAWPHFAARGSDLMASCSPLGREDLVRAVDRLLGQLESLEGSVPGLGGPAGMFGGALAAVAAGFLAKAARRREGQSDDPPGDGDGDGGEGPTFLLPGLSSAGGLRWALEER